jgi:Spy/CpxP family protein refolding chaperone
MKSLHRILLPIAALLASSVFAAQGAPAPQSPPDDAQKQNQYQHRSENAEALHGLLNQFREQRDQYIAARQALMQRLRTCTDAERQQILEQLRLENQARVAEQRALGKQIRDELRRLREQRRTGG